MSGLNADGVLLEVTIKMTMPDGSRYELEVPKMVGDVDVKARDLAFERDIVSALAMPPGPPDWHMWIDLSGRPLATDDSGTLWTARKIDPT